MKKTATFENLPHYSNKKGTSSVVNIGRLVLFLVCVIGLTWLLTIFVLHSPNPFHKFMSKRSYPRIKNNELNLEKYYNSIDQITPVIHPQNENVEGKCDLFKGRWVPDPNGPSYTNWSCPTIPEYRNCIKFGRKDTDYMNWRWKPDECELPRFNSKTFLKIVQGKKLALIGDSLARNQFDSLLCLLSQGDTPKEIKDVEEPFRTFYFPTYNFTLMVFWTKFLVASEERGNSTISPVFNIHLDKIDINWADKLPDLNYAIISASHWYIRENYLYGGGKLIGCIYCKDPGVHDYGLPFALQKAFATTLKYISECKECRKDLLTLVRTFSPTHFEYGTWNTGGKCNRTSPITEEQVDIEGTKYERELRDVQIKEFDIIKNTANGMMFESLDITKAMIMRPDGHPGNSWKDRWTDGKNRTDCVHWCLPGPIDVWNDFLMAVVQKKNGSTRLL
ncbi:hypothetical protein MKW98_000616 [Papaver atlanticum]|uniref:Trichome birefringence-like N-terminal domain-containing protein n=1 Tax=Papaver atlanticum TaxID=357466 RepID=A0AAD4S5H5_9MAGN|nr:hypothetical protein MKW98_000616 [Papaver atlanticum]